MPGLSLNALSSLKASQICKTALSARFKEDLALCKTDVQISALQQNKRTFAGDGVGGGEIWGGGEEGERELPSPVRVELFIGTRNNLNSAVDAPEQL